MRKKKKVGDLSIRKFKEMKQQCKDCECMVDDCIRCKQENPNLYVICDIALGNITDKDMEKVIEVEE